MSTPNTDYWWWGGRAYGHAGDDAVSTRETGNLPVPGQSSTPTTATPRRDVRTPRPAHYRDARYVYPGAPERERQEGLLVPGRRLGLCDLGLVLADLPPKRPHRARLRGPPADHGRRAAAPCNSPDGYWGASPDGSAHAPGPRPAARPSSSPCALGHQPRRAGAGPLPARRIARLDLSEHGGAAGGRAVSYMQPIGDRAIPGQVVDRNSSRIFVGAFLLAAAEMVPAAGPSLSP